MAYPNIAAFRFIDDASLQKNEDLPTEISDKYFISKVIGSGAFGKVFMVYDIATCEKHALKQIKKGLDDANHDVNESQREIQIMQGLRHPCIVQMIHFLDRIDTLYITLEFVDGGDLFHLIERQKYLAENDAKFIFYQLCHAVRYLHGEQITHRDIKPENVLLKYGTQQQNGHPLVKLGDFGLSKVINSSNMALGSYCGTPM